MIFPPRLNSLKVRFRNWRWIDGKGHNIKATLVFTWEWLSISQKPEILGASFAQATQLSMSLLIHSHLVPLVWRFYGIEYGVVTKFQLPLECEGADTSASLHWVWKTKRCDGVKRMLVEVGKTECDTVLFTSDTYKCQVLDKVTYVWQAFNVLSI